MSILARIVADKKIEVGQRKKIFPIAYWEASPLFEQPTNSLAKRLRESKSGIIAEHKRRSPSKQHINNSLSVANVAIGISKSFNRFSSFAKRIYCRRISIN